MDIITRANKIFDKLIIVMPNQQSKSTWLDVTVRVKLLSDLFPNLTIATFDGLLVDCLKDHHASILVRGLRNANDLIFEQQLDAMNKAMMDEIETVWLNTNPAYTHITSSLVREVAKLGGGISAFVPDVVAEGLSGK